MELNDAQLFLILSTLINLDEAKKYMDVAHEIDDKFNENSIVLPIYVCQPIIAKKK